MQQWRWLILGWVAGLVLVLVSPAGAAEVDLRGEAELAVKSAFLWRGDVINDEAVISPYLALHAEGWRLSAWGSWNVTDADDRSDHSRVDVTLEYSGEWNRQIFTVGSVAYLYRDSDRAANQDTFEAFLGYTVDVVTLPSLTLYYDFQEIEGFYASVSLRHGVPLVENRLALEMGASLGAGDEDYMAGVFTLPANEASGFEGFAPDGAALVDVNVTLDLPLELGDAFTLMPGFRYMEVVDSELKDALEAVGRKTDEVMWSLRGTYYF